MTEKQRKRISVVVIGHVDSGKSTTMGKMLQLLDPSPASRRNTDAPLAWSLDKLKAERERGITIDLSVCRFETASRAVTIIDAPGHRDFIKNMITGTSQADAAVLMVAARRGEFEDGFSLRGQTREHARLAHTMGVRQLIVCVNKMDDPTVNFEQQRYDEICAEVERFLHKCGHRSIVFVPASGLTGVNLVEEAGDVMPWYSGPTLAGAIDALKVPPRPTSLPLRLPLQDVYKISGIGTVASGRVETGVIRRGMNVVFAPSPGGTAAAVPVRSIEVHHEDVSEGMPGDNVGFNVRVAARQLRRGMVAGDAASKNPPRVAVSFVAQVVVLNHRRGIRAGYTPVVSCHTAHVPCRFARILAKLDRRTGSVSADDVRRMLAKKDEDGDAKEDARATHVKTGEACIVVLEPLKPMCVEPFKEFAPLGRFAVRDMATTVAVGVVVSVRHEGDPELGDAEEESEREEESL